MEVGKIARPTGSLLSQSVLRAPLQIALQIRCPVPGPTGSASDPVERLTRVQMLMTLVQSKLALLGTIGIKTRPRDMAARDARSPG